VPRGADGHLDADVPHSSKLRIQKLATVTRGLLGALVAQELLVPCGEVLGLRTSQETQDVERILVTRAVSALAVVDLVDLRVATGPRSPSSSR
jgi:hypothetical protein